MSCIYNPYYSFVFVFKTWGVAKFKVLIQNYKKCELKKIGYRNYFVLGNLNDSNQTLNTYFEK